MKAIFVRDLNDFTGSAKLYRVDPPAPYGYDDEVTEYVAVSKVPNAFASETYIFPANEKGEVINWGEMDGSLRGDHSHESVLRDAGYEVE